MATLIDTAYVNSGRYKDHINKVINLDLCTTVHKTTYRTYPDNEGSPAIAFGDIDEYWVFDDDDTRDMAFDNIGAFSR